MRTDGGTRVALLERLLLALLLASIEARAAEPGPPSFEQRPTLPGQKPGRAEVDAAAAERARAQSAAAPKDAAAPAPRTSFEYKPLYDSRRGDDELGSSSALKLPGSKPQQDYSELNLLTLGAGVSFGYLGHRWQCGPFGDGLTALEASFVPFVSGGLLWLGFWGSFSRDSGLERSRLGLGLESGIGPWGLSVGPLLKVKGEGKGPLGLETRLSFSAPAAYNRPDYERACCPAHSELRSCACAHRVSTLLVEPDLRMEYWSHEPGPDVRVFAGLTGKFGLAY